MKTIQPTEKSRLLIVKKKVIVRFDYAVINNGRENLSTIVTQDTTATTISTTTTII